MKRLKTKAQVLALLIGLFAPTTVSFATQSPSMMGSMEGGKMKQTMTRNKGMRKKHRMTKKHRTVRKSGPMAGPGMKKPG